MPNPIMTAKMITNSIPNLIFNTFITTSTTMAIILLEIEISSIRNGSYY